MMDHITIEDFVPTGCNKRIYVFILVVEATAKNCYDAQAVVVKQSSGYIGNNYASHNNIGVVGCPWRIEAPVGGLNNT